MVLVDEETGHTHLLDRDLMSDITLVPLNDPRMQPAPAGTA